MRSWHEHQTTSPFRFFHWPAFWMYGNNWPSGGEIDAVEANFDKNYVSYHYGSVSNPQQVSTFNETLTPVSMNISPGWHTIDISYGGAARDAELFPCGTTGSCT